MSGGSTSVSAPTISAPKINIDSAIADLLKSAEVLVPALQTAGINLNQGVLQSNALLSGYGDISNNALGMQQQLLGLAPVDSKGQQVQQQLSGLRDVFITSEASKDPAMVDQFSQLNAQIGAAYGLKDPTARQAAFDQAMQSFTSIQKSLNSYEPLPGQAPVISDIEKLRSDKQITVAAANNILSKYTTGGKAVNDRGGRTPDGKFLALEATNTDRMTVNDAMGKTKADGNWSSYNDFIDFVKAQSDFTGAQSSQAGAAGTAQDPNAKQQAQKVSGYLQDLQQQMQYSYSSEPQKALTSGQISETIQSNPEYLAAYDSGMQAIERAAAAGGMLSSGNTLKAAADFGQQLSGSVFGNLYNRLSGLSSQTLPMVSQNSSQLPGNSMVSYNNAMGPATARSGSLQQTGQLRGQTAISQAQLQMQASMANQQAQLQANMANAQTNAGTNAGFGGIAGTLAGGFGKKLGIF